MNEIDFAQRFIDLYRKMFKFDETLRLRLDFINNEYRSDDVFFDKKKFLDIIYEFHLIKFLIVQLKQDNFKLPINRSLFYDDHLKNINEIFIVLRQRFNQLLDFIN